MYELIEFIASELKELESRDVDTLYACISENLQDMGIKLDAETQEFTYSEIERHETTNFKSLVL
jgi:hypothetical protein